MVETTQSTWGPRYLGLREPDRKQPWSRFFTPELAPLQDQVSTALAGPATAETDIPAFADLQDELNAPGYSAVENGYGKRGRLIWVATHTRMPGVTAQMWDWWFTWHVTHGSRYKLWHPQAHAYASISGAPPAVGDADRRPYVGRVSFVDEFIGKYLQQLAIRFDDPVSAGFAVPDGSTVIWGRVGSAILPINLGRLCHQIRPVIDGPDGAGVEMRSRFYLNLLSLRRLDAVQAAAAIRRGFLPTLRTPLPFPVSFGKALLEHCGQEMNHLAGFLPELYAEFKHTP